MVRRSRMLGAVTAVSTVVTLAVTVPAPSQALSTNDWPQFGRGRHPGKPVGHARHLEHPVDGFSAADEAKTKSVLAHPASAEILIDVIANTHEGRSLLVVGHNPSLHDLAVQLIGSGNSAAREELSEKLPTSGLVVIDIQLERWSQLQRHPQAGPLERFVTPRFIATIQR